ncbi:family 20 glycosylhydrolase [uncultured Sphaerochaeta sp.]|uniref:family 20 glycosylhydrolase n=1 Tax=uncultured Sphaerochaeta sp. TaxID=886478 RepID=UPI002A0A5466|nr:family 20 glycosylhydrolase [uncultured Sphaerochaeta sp.]
MHTIPKVKQFKYSPGYCQYQQGLSIENLDASQKTVAESLLSPFIGDGIPIKIGNRPVSVPDGLPHDQLLVREAYRITVAEDVILIDALHPMAVRNAFATLAQLLMQEVSSLPCLMIEDYPSIPYRGVMLDVSRGKIPNRAKMEEVIRFLASYKYNVLQLYMEDCYVLDSHPLLSRSNGYYTRDEIQYLDAYCQRFGIELQPNLQCLSHAHGLLRNPGYHTLAESEVSLFSFAAGSEAVYNLYSDIFNEVLPWFSSKTLNLDLDEAYDLGTGYSKDAVENLGGREVFKRHIQKIAEVARKAGATQLQLWGDCLNKYPDLQTELEDDFLFIDWNYNPLTYFPSLDNHDAKAHPFWLAPGTSSWNALFPRTQQANANICSYIREGFVRQVQGVLVTHWGDYGHHQPISFSYHGFVRGAEHAYNGATTSEEDLDRALDILFFTDMHESKAYSLLAQINTLPSVTTSFKTQAFFAFFDDLFKGLSLEGNSAYPALPEDTFTSMSKLAELAIDELKKSNCASYFQQELLHAAHCLLFTGKKGVLSYTIKHAFQEDMVDEDRILSWILDIKELYRTFLSLRNEFVRLWSLEAVDIGSEGAIYAFDKASSRYAEAVIWLNKQRLILRQGLPLDTQMETYKAHEAYTTLWTGNCTNLWDRAYPWR